MQIIGFNLSKILAERAENFQRSPINTNIEFLDLKTKMNGDLVTAEICIKTSENQLMQFNGISLYEFWLKGLNPHAM